MIDEDDEEPETEEGAIVRQDPQHGQHAPHVDLHARQQAGQHEQGDDGAGEPAEHGAEEAAEPVVC